MKQVATCRTAMLQLAQWDLWWETVIFNRFSKILLTFLQRRNQFCPIKQKTKESLVQLFSFELLRYYNYKYYTRYSVTKQWRRRHSASSYQDIIKNTLICEKAPDAARHHISNPQEVSDDLLLLLCPAWKREGSLSVCVVGDTYLKKWRVWIQIYLTNWKYYIKTQPCSFFLDDILRRHSWTYSAPFKYLT